MGRVRTEMDTLRKNNNNKILEVKNTITEIKKASDGLISRLEKTEKRICELENKSIESTQKPLHGCL